jgi:hypothetical protein
MHKSNRTFVKGDRVVTLTQQGGFVAGTYAVDAKGPCVLPFLPYTFGHRITFRANKVWPLWYAMIDTAAAVKYFAQFGVKVVRKPTHSGLFQATFRVTNMDAKTLFRTLDSFCGGPDVDHDGSANFFTAEAAEGWIERNAEQFPESSFWVEPIGGFRQVWPGPINNEEKAELENEYFGQEPWE